MKENKFTEIWFHGQRVETDNTHGTGCTLSSAIAALPLVGRCTCVRGAGTGAQHR